MIHSKPFLHPLKKKKELKIWARLGNLNTIIVKIIQLHEKKNQCILLFNKLKEYPVCYTRTTFFTRHHTIEVNKN